MIRESIDTPGGGEIKIYTHGRQWGWLFTSQSGKAGGRSHLRTKKIAFKESMKHVEMNTKRKKDTE